MSKKIQRKDISTKPGALRSLFDSVLIFWEFFVGFRFIKNFKKAASFFGSSRESLPNHFYEDCEELAARLSRRGFTIITGGGGGIMRAANKGAYRVEGQSIGISIDIPSEHKENSFLKHVLKFRYFFSRKTILSCASELYIFFPGGYGTLDEFFEMLTMIQTGHSEQVPILLYGETYWQRLVSFIEEELRDKYKSINKEHANFFIIVNSVDEAERYIDSLDITHTRSCKVGSLM